MKPNSVRNKIRILLLRFQLEWALIPLLAIKELSLAKRRKSFSQFGEDLELRKICPKIGFYIDVGSGRPISGSNTFLLYEDGWSGILIDPININKLLVRLTRTRDKFIKALIGPPKELDFYYLYPYEYSTTSPGTARELTESGKAELVKKTKLEAIGFQGILPSSSSMCFLLCIDAEGMDFEILKRFPFELQKPDVICVEEHEDNNHGPKSISSLLVDHGYSLHKRLGLSVIYILKDSKYICI
jgi:hypothetical protein